MKDKKHIHEHNSIENIKIAFYLNIMFSILEAIGGFLTNSMSIMSDAIHDLGDAFSVGLSYIFERKSKKNPNDKYTYGYLRYSLLGALITSVVLLLGSIFIIYNSIPRIITPEEVNYDGMIIFAIFGVIINGYAAYRTSKGVKANEKVISLHMLEDVLGWIVVLIGSICIKLFELYIIDPILSLLISIYILFHVYKHLKNVFNIFMEKVPSEFRLEEIKEKVTAVNPVIKDIHHIHIWTMDGENNYMTAHILLNGIVSEKEVIKLKKSIKETLNDLNIFHVTLEIEYKNEVCNDKNCDKAI
ncbi:MAG: cation transporter [Tenericutes bacterium]|nr:cation transporter [Mycoplasmatota bacterium]